MKYYISATANSSMMSPAEKKTDVYFLKVGYTNSKLQKYHRTCRLDVPSCDGGAIYWRFYMLTTYLLTNVSSLIEPMDQKIIQNFKFPSCSSGPQKFRLFTGGFPKESNRKSCGYQAFGAPVHILVQSRAKRTTH